MYTHVTLINLNVENYMMNWVDEFVNDGLWWLYDDENLIMWMWWIIVELFDKV